MEQLSYSVAAVRRVFLSSTSVDLRAHRAAVHDTLERMRLAVADMAQFGAQPTGDGTTVSLDELARSDVYLLVVAWRYGHVPDGQALSITQQEYEAAQRLGKPCFVYLADPATEARDGTDDLFPVAVRDPEHAQQLRNFRAELLHKDVVDTFTEPNDLARKVAVDFLRHINIARPVPRDIPPAARDFVGREEEVARLLAILRAGQSVAISAAVAGLAGIGKSTLAAETVRRLVKDPSAFPGGVAYIFCGSQEGSTGQIWIYDRLLDAWGAGVKATQPGLVQESDAAIAGRERALRERLRPSGEASPALVLLDNVEEGLPLGPVLATLGALDVSVLATSRHLPAVSGLNVLRLEVLEPGPALALFAARFREAGGDWQEVRDAEPAGQSVALLGNLPLAIELAASYAALANLRITDLSDELVEHNRLDPLTPATDPTRGVRFAFAKTHAHLDAPTQLAFAVLGFPAGADWPREVIERMLAGAFADWPGAPTPTAALVALAARSLVTLTAEPAAAGGAPTGGCVCIPSCARMQASAGPSCRLGSGPPHSLHWWRPSLPLQLPVQKMFQAPPSASSLARLLPTSKLSAMSCRAACFRSCDSSVPRRATGSSRLTCVGLSVRPPVTSAKRSVLSSTSSIAAMHSRQTASNWFS